MSAKFRIFVAENKSIHLKPISKMKKLLTLAVALVCTALGAIAQDYPYSKLYENLPFKMDRVERPSFPDRTASVADFGAKGDGTTLCTAAIQKAIDQTAQKGGGKVVVPQGVWFTGPIVLKSNINLHLEKGAILLFSPDYNLYPIVETVFEGLDTRRCQSPISARGARNVAITGEGVVDGNGQHWRPLKRDKVTESYWKEVTAKGGAYIRDGFWIPTEGARKGYMMADMNVPTGNLTEAQWDSIKVFLRPVMVNLVSCKNVWLNGVIFQNSPAWNLHPLMCENVLIEGVEVRNPSFAQNGDGLDLESCKNTLIVNSRFDVGDDGICIKSGKDENGRKRGIPCQNVIVDGCTVFKGHGGFVVGSEMSGGVKNISVSNCQFLGTDVGLRFKSKRGRGGIVENIWIKNISMFDIPTEAVIFNLYYGGMSAAEAKAAGKNKTEDVKPMPVDETTPCFRNIYIEDIVCKNAHRAMFFNGLPEMPVENINLKNISITAEKPAEFKYCKGIKQENVNVVINRQ